MSTLPLGFSMKDCYQQSLSRCKFEAIELAHYLSRHGQNQLSRSPNIGHAILRDASEEGEQAAIYVWYL